MCGREREGGFPILGLKVLLWDNLSYNIDNESLKESPEIHTIKYYIS